MKDRILYNLKLDKHEATSLYYILMKSSIDCILDEYEEKFIEDYKINFTKCLIKEDYKMLNKEDIEKILNWGYIKLNTKGLSNEEMELIEYLNLLERRTK